MGVTVSPVTYISRSPYTPLYLSLAVLFIVVLWRYLLGFLLLLIRIEMTDWLSSMFIDSFSAIWFPRHCCLTSRAFLSWDCRTKHKICPEWHIAFENCDLILILILTQEQMTDLVPDWGNNGQQRRLLAFAAERKFFLEFWLDRLHFAKWWVLLMMNWVGHAYTHTHTAV